MANFRFLPPLKLRYWLINDSHYSAVKISVIVILISTGLPIILSTIWGAVLGAGWIHSVNITLSILFLAAAAGLLAAYFLYSTWCKQAQWEDLMLTTPVCRQHNVQTIYDVKNGLVHDGSQHNIRKELATWAWDIPLTYERKLLLIEANIHPHQALTPQTRSLTDEDLIIMGALNRDMSQQATS